MIGEFALKNERICLITFSNNSDYQRIIYSMFAVLNKRGIDVYTIGKENPKSKNAQFTDRNIYLNCPDRPGLDKGAFRLSELFRVAKIIKRNHIRYLYFESLHLWNFFLMLLCPQCIKIEAIHDVIPHDGNKGMTLCNFVTSHMADAVLLRNKKYIDILREKYILKKKRIISFDFWNDFPKKSEILGTGNFLYFGRIRPYKGLDTLYEIIKETPDAHFQIVGAPDEDTEGLLAEFSLFSNVEVIAREVTESEMETFFYNADWIVLPYKSATQSGVIMDAYRYSRPVIAFDVGAFAEQVIDGKTGFLIPEGDAVAFAQIVRKVNGFTQEETAQFAHAAYRYGYNKYAAEAVADRFLEVIYSIKK